MNLHKAVLSGGALYAVQVSRTAGATPDAIAVQVSGGDARRAVLPTALGAAVAVPWDVTSSAWFLVAFLDVAPGQRSCQLARLPLSDLSFTAAEPPTPTSRVPRFTDLIAHVPPLSMEMAAAQAKGAGQVFADIVVVGDRHVELYIATGKTISMFEYDGGSWTPKWQAARESAQAFVAVRHAQATYLVTEQGDILTHAGGSIQTIASLRNWGHDGAGAVNLVVENADQDELLFAHSTAGQSDRCVLGVQALRGTEMRDASIAAPIGEALARLCRLVSVGP